MTLVGKLHYKLKILHTIWLYNTSLYFFLAEAGASVCVCKVSHHTPVTSICALILFSGCRVLKETAVWRLLQPAVA